MFDRALTGLSDALADRDRAAGEMAAAPDAGGRACWELEHAAAELRVRESRRRVAASLALAFAACRAVEPGLLAGLLGPELDTGAIDIALGNLAHEVARLKAENWELAVALAALEQRQDATEFELRGRLNGGHSAAETDGQGPARGRRPKPARGPVGLAPDPA